MAPGRDFREPYSSKLFAQSASGYEIRVGKLFRDRKTSARTQNSAQLDKGSPAVRKLSENRNQKNVIEGAGPQRQSAHVGVNECRAQIPTGSQAATCLEKHLSLDV